jgi:hypothetical protein
MKKIQITLLVACFIFIFACSHYDSLEKNGKVSDSNKKSHNSGQDCMSCHGKEMSEAANEAWWNVAGTVYNSNGGLNTNARIELWSLPNAKGIKILSLNVDRNANFYTEKVVNFNGGCYPVAISGSDTMYMYSKFNGTGCNSCHNDVTTKKIFVK